MDSNNQQVLIVRPKDMLIEPIEASLKEYLRDTNSNLTIWTYNDHNLAKFDIAAFVRQSKPSSVIYISTAGGPYLIPTAVWRSISEIAPIACLCYDASHPDYWHLFDEYHEASCFKTIVNMDGVKEWPAGSNDLTMLPPLSPVFFHDEDPLVDRPVRVGFCGGFPDGYRREVVTYLMGRRLLTLKPREGAWGTYQSYANFLTKCQFVLNTSMNSTYTKSVVKARVVETGLARACLLEQRGSYISNYLTEGIHYLTYGTPEEAADIIESLKPTGIMQEIANNLHKKIIEDHSPLKFWDTVYDKL